MHQELSGHAIRTVALPRERRRGYQVAAVDDLLEAIAAEVDRLRGEVSGLQHTERSAMLLLQQAQGTADRTVAEAADEAAAILQSARDEAAALLDSSRAEARQRVSGAEAQIEAAFTEASNRLNELEREIHSRRRELALLEAGSARFAADQASRMRAAADVLLAAATSITAASADDAVDALVVGPGPESRRPDGTDDAVDLRVRVDDLVTG